MLFFLIFKVHGAGCPAGRAGLQKDDAIILVNEKDVISLKHNEFVQLIKSLLVMKLTMVVERFVHNYFTIVEFKVFQGFGRMYRSSNDNNLRLLYTEDFSPHIF